MIITHPTISNSHLLTLFLSRTSTTGQNLNSTRPTRKIMKNTISISFRIRIQTNRPSNKSSQPSSLATLSLIPRQCQNAHLINMRNKRTKAILSRNIRSVQPAILSQRRSTIDHDLSQNSLPYTSIHTNITQTMTMRKISTKSSILRRKDTDREPHRAQKTSIHQRSANSASNLHHHNPNSHDGPILLNLRLLMLPTR